MSNQPAKTEISLAADELKDHVEIDFSTPEKTPASNNNNHNAQQEASAITKEEDKKTKPQGKVSPFTNMHHKLNFIPHSQRDKINTQFLSTLPGVFKLAEIVSEC
jgi:hypothetical protein